MGSVTATRSQANRTAILGDLASLKSRLVEIQALMQEPPTTPARRIDVAAWDLMSAIQQVDVITRRVDRELIP